MLSRRPTAKPNPQNRTSHVDPKGAPGMKHLRARLVVRSSLFLLAAVAGLALILTLDRISLVSGAGQVKPYESGIVWEEPKQVTFPAQGSPPSDAIVLFDGKNMDAWEGG